MVSPISDILYFSMAGGMKLVLALVVVSVAVVTGSDYVNFMSIQMEEAERLYNLPDLPTLAGQLGLKSLVSLVVKAGLAQTLSAKGQCMVSFFCLSTFCHFRDHFIAVDF